MPVAGSPPTECRTRPRARRDGTWQRVPVTRPSVAAGDALTVRAWVRAAGGRRTPRHRHAPPRRAGGRGSWSCAADRRAGVGTSHVEVCSRESFRIPSAETTDDDGSSRRRGVPRTASRMGAFDGSADHAHPKRALRFVVGAAPRGRVDVDEFGTRRLPRCPSRPPATRSSAHRELGHRGSSRQAREGQALPGPSASGRTARSCYLRMCGCASAVGSVSWRPASRAMIAASPRSPAPSLVRMLLTWVLAVR